MSNKRETNRKSDKKTKFLKKCLHFQVIQTFRNSEINFGISLKKCFW